VQVTTSRQHDWNPTWGPDGSLMWDEQRNADSILWRARRTPDGHWGRPEMVSPGMVGGAVPRLSPDGRWVAIRDGGLRLYDMVNRTEHLVYPINAFAAWSADSRVLYYVTDPDSSGRWIIQSASPIGGTPRTLAYGNNPVTESRRFGFAMAAGQFFFPVVERKADIWVAEIRAK
jgi:hypothetical protein